MYRFCCLLAMLQVSLVWAASAQAQSNSFFNRRKRIVIPFETYNNLIVVPVKINGSETLNFILDTGAGMTLLTDPKAIRFLQLPFVRTLNIGGMGEGESLLTSVSVNNEVFMGSSQARLHNILALEEDVLALSSYIGAPVHGILGCDFFHAFVVEINFMRKEICLYQPEHYKEPRKGVTYPLTLENQKPHTYIDLLVDGAPVTIKVLLDTGAGHALLLDANSIAPLQLPEKRLRMELGRGLSGIIKGHLGRVEGMRIGGSELDEVLTSFPDTNSVALAAYRNSGRQGNVGCEVLNRFKVTFNFPKRYVHFKPYRSRINKPFERDMSGLELRAIGEQFDRVVVSSVIPGSAADRAGLVPDDEIVLVDAMPAAAMKLSEIYKNFQRKSGRKVHLLVRRGDEFYMVPLQLRRLI